MSRLTIYRDNQADSTVVSNLFIDQYMKDANDAQLKVYLYLLRMMSAYQPTSVSDIADRFNHTEKDVLRALKYWQFGNIHCLWCYCILYAAFCDAERVGDIGNGR